MKTFILSLLLVFIGSVYLLAQVPKITGFVTLSATKGVVECDLEISNIPKLKKYSIWLNAGLNVRHFRDSSDKFNYEYNRYFIEEKSGEAFQYSLLKDRRTVLPTKIRLNYVGAFPVITDTLRMSRLGDWKGNMAFNGKNLRASETVGVVPYIL